MARAPEEPNAAHPALEHRATDGSVASSGDAERRAITGRAGIVAAGTLASRLLGLGRDLALAALFTRLATDAFMVAFTIPNALRQLLAEGAVQNAVLPVLTKTREEQGDGAARRFFAAARGLSLVVLTLVSVAGVVFAPALVDLFASGYREHAGQFERTVELTRWLFPYIFFMGTAALGVAALNSYGRFVATAFAPALLNVAFIGAALLLPGWLGARGYDPILAMAIGALVGGALQVVAQWPSLAKIGFLSRPTLDLVHPGIRDALRRMGPVLFGLGVYYVDVVLARRFLSELGVGAQTYFGFALRLCDFPQGIFVMAIQSAALPSLAALAARGDRAELAETYAYGVRLTLFVAIAATVMVVALAEPLVILIFERGQFDAVASRETAHALIAQGSGVWMVAVVRQLLAVYFAVGDTRTPVIVAALDLCVFVALALALRGPLGHVGVSLAVTGSGAAQLALLWILLGRHVKSRKLAAIGRSAARTLGASLIAAAAALLVARALAAAEMFGRHVPGLAATAIFGGVFLASAWLLGSEELRAIVSVLKRRAHRSVRPQGGDRKRDRGAH